MARYLFGDGISDWGMLAPSTSPAVATADGSSLAGVVVAAGNLPTGDSAVPLVADEPGGTIITDLLDADDNVIPNITTDSNGYIVPFQADDGRKAVAVSLDGGVIWRWLVATEALVEAADSSAPFVIIGPTDTEPPPGTDAGTLIFREVF